jgi:hypothetical protein
MLATSKARIDIILPSGVDRKAVLMFVNVVLNTSLNFVGDLLELTS